MPRGLIAPESGAFIVLLGTVAMLTSLAVDMSLPALPTLARDFAAAPDTVQLTLSLFFIGYAIGQLLYGPISDRVGRRPALLVGLGVFSLAGFLSAASGQIEVLIALRFVHGISAASGPVLARAIVRDHFGGARAAQGLSAVLAVMSIAPLVAPFLGGVMLNAFGWRSIFLLLGVLGLALFALTWASLRESLKHPDAQALKPHRLVANFRAFLTNRMSAGYALVNAVAFSALFAYISGSPFVLIDVYGVPSARFGLMFGMSAGGFMVGSLINGRLVRRLRIDAMLRLGFSIAVAAGALLLVCAWFGLGGAWGISLSFVLFAIGLALVMPNATAAAMEPLPHMAGTAAAIVGAAQMATGSVVGYMVNRLFDGTAMPMAWTIALAALIAFALYFLLVRRGAV